MDDNSRNSILYIVYLSILGCCCISPTLYYIRSYLQQRQRSSRLRELEQAGMVMALHHSQRLTLGGGHRSHERSAVRHERRARIAQLMEPVLMTLKEEHFKNPPPPHEGPVPPEQPLPPSLPVTADPAVNEADDDEELGKKPQDTFSDMTSVSSADSALEDDAGVITIPKPGLEFNDATGDATALRGTSRDVPAYCTICLSGFTTGSEIVWSSNCLCDHVFDKACMEEWLVKQHREGPICPCCRRDFLVDPYDLSLPNNNADGSNIANTTSDADHLAMAEEGNINATTDVEVTTMDGITIQQPGPSFVIEIVDSSDEVEGFPPTDAFVVEGESDDDADDAANDREQVNDPDSDRLLHDSSESGERSEASA